VTPDGVVGQNIDRHAGRGSPVKRARAAMSLVLALLGTLRAAVKACTDLALLRRRSKRPRVGLLDHVFWMQPPAATRATDTSSVNSARNLLQSGVASKLDATAWSDSRSEKSKSSRKRERQPAPPSDTCSGPLEAITRAARAPQGSR
jgi:hypothetical protein